ncbi:MAG: deoxynucleoside kinase [Chitinophagales bacterium]|nr:deoxynucleoside kinase [Chitinophagales bacterium]
MRYNFITIEGTIGAGKTTLAKKLAADFNGKLILEQFEENPFLPKFYEDPQRHAFPVELYFMAERFQHLNKLLSEADIFKSFTVSDFLFQKSLIFANNNLNEDEARLYRMLFDIINPSLPRPDLVIYLYAPVEKLLHNIQKRGRVYEQNISAAYLEHIQSAYLDYFKMQTQSRIVLVNTTRLNFAESKEDYKVITELLTTEFNTGLHFV